MNDIYVTVYGVKQENGIKIKNLNHCFNWLISFRHKVVLPINLHQTIFGSKWNISSSSKAKKKFFSMENNDFIVYRCISNFVLVQIQL